MTIKINSLVLNSKDNVAVTLVQLGPDDTGNFKLPEENDAQSINVTQEIPLYHKFAIAEISEGEDVIKYGQVIGRALSNIGIGDHVHTHNVVSKREGIEQ